MTDAVHLVLRTHLEETLEVEGLTPDRLALLDEAAIAALPVWAGSRQARLGDYFHVRGGRSARVWMEGTLDRVDGLGAGTRAGELVIDGAAGGRVAAAMSGGSVEVRGHAGDDAGLAMQGGTLRIRGNAGERLGAATPGAARGMVGGEIVVLGAAGTLAGHRARRGLIVVGGAVGDYAAEAMIAGTLVAFGPLGAAPGRGSKRGAIVACGGVEVPETYRYACTYEPGYVRLLMTWLQRHHRLPVPDAALRGPYRRYCGDMGIPGRGEILELER